MTIAGLHAHYASAFNMPIKLNLSCITSRNVMLAGLCEHQHRRGPAAIKPPFSRHAMTDTDKARMTLQSGTGRRAVAAERFALVLRKAASLMRMWRDAAPATVGSASTGDDTQSGAGGREMQPQAGPKVGRLSDVVASAARHSARAQACHDDAGVRVDAALYELEQLRQELKAVVDPRLLARSSGTSEAAASQGSGAAKVPEQAGDVITGGRAGSTRSAA